MSRKPTPPKPPARRRRGFEHTASLLSGQIRKLGETRGFAVSRLLTHWAEIVGTDLAGSAQPVKVHYGRQGLGATLTVLTTGAQAPMLEMQKEKIRDKVNACYGYAAISRIRITQTAPTGFAEPKSEFTAAPKNAPNPQAKAVASSLSRDVGDESLREALEKLGENVLRKQETARRP